MRQLKLSRQPTDSAWPADQALALPLLQSLATAQPLPLLPAETERLLRFIMAVARQHRGRGAAWEMLLREGYAGAAHCYATSAEPDKWLSWWVRQRILAATVPVEGDSAGISA